MIESALQIETCLRVSGELVTFAERTIPGDPPTVIPEYTVRMIPGNMVYNVQDYSSPFDLENQDFTFQMSAEDYRSNNIKPGDIFTYEVPNTTNQVTTFQITSSQDDHHGWVRLPCKIMELT